MTKERHAETLLLTVEQTAALLQISRSLAYDAIARGEIPHVRIGRVIRVPRVGLESWIRSRAGLPTPPAEGVDFARRHAPQRH